MTTPMFSSRIPTSGPSGNIFVILGRARSLLEQIGRPREEIDELSRVVLEAKSYEEACDHVRRYFPLEDDD
jgi:hypothetical protein